MRLFAAMTLLLLGVALILWFPWQHRSLRVVAGEMAGGGFRVRSVPSRPDLLNFEMPRSEARYIDHLVVNEDLYNQRLLSGQLQLARSLNDMQSANDVAYLISSKGHLIIVDCEGELPQVVASMELPGSLQRVAIAGTLLLVSSLNTGVHLVDVADPQNPILLQTLILPGDCYDMVMVDQLVYLACGRDGLLIADLKRPGKARLVGQLSLPGDTRRLVLQAGRLVVAANGGLLSLLDLSTPSSPVTLAEQNVSGHVKSLAVDGKKLYVACGPDGLALLRQERSQLRLVWQNDSFGELKHLAMVDGELLLAAKNEISRLEKDSDSGLKRVSITVTRSPVTGLAAVRQGLLFSTTHTGLGILPIPEQSEGIPERPAPMLKSVTELAVNGQGLLASGWPNGLELLTPNADGRLVSRASLGPSWEAGLLGTNGHLLLATHRDRDVEILQLDSQGFHSLGRIQTDNMVSRFAVFGDLVALMTIDQQLYLVDISKVSHPLVLARHPLRAKVDALVLGKDFLVTAGTKQGLELWSWSREEGLQIRDRWSGEGGVPTVLLNSGADLYLATQAGKLHWLKIDAGRRLLLRSSQGGFGPLTSGALSEGQMFFGAMQKELLRFRRTVDGAPEFVGRSRLASRISAMCVAGSYLYVVTNEGGMRFSLLNPSALMDARSFGRIGDANQVAVADGQLFVSAIKKGLYGFSIPDGRAPQLLAHYQIYARGFVQWKDRILLLDSHGFRVVSLENGETFHEQARFYLGEATRGIDSFSNHVFLADRRGLVVVKLRNGLKPSLQARLDLPGYPLGIGHSRDYLLIPCARAGTALIDVRRPEKPQLVKMIRASGPLGELSQAVEVAFYGGYAYIATGDTGLMVVDMHNLPEADLVAVVGMNGFAHGVSVVEGQLMVSVVNQGLWQYSLEDPLRPQLFAKIEAPGGAVSPLFRGERIFYASHRDGIGVSPRPRRLLPVETGGKMIRFQTRNAQQPRIFSAWSTDGQLLWKGALYADGVGEPVFRNLEGG